MIFEQQPRDFLLKFRGGNAHGPFFGLYRVPYPRKHVSNLIRHALSPSFLQCSKKRLPAGLHHAGYQPVKRHLPEADPAQAETAKVSALASAPPAPVVPPRFKLRCLSALFHHRFSCHGRLSLTRILLIKK
jgi:hypothetical protein